MLVFGPNKVPDINHCPHVQWFYYFIEEEDSFPFASKMLLALICLRKHQYFRCVTNPYISTGGSALIGRLLRRKLRHLRISRLSCPQMNGLPRPPRGTRQLFSPMI